MDQGLSQINQLQVLDNKFDNFDYTKEESEAGYKNFCVLDVKLKVLNGYI